MLFVLRASAVGQTRPLRELALAGLLFGVACVLKLTTMVFAAGAGLALIVAWPGTVGAKLEAAVVFGAADGLGIAAVAGWWWLRVWHSWGNPFVPLYNNVFRSPFAAPVDFVDARFKPKTLWRVLTYPFECITPDRASSGTM